MLQQLHAFGLLIKRHEIAADATAQKQSSERNRISAVLAVSDKNQNLPAILELLSNRQCGMLHQKNRRDSLLFDCIAFELLHLIRRYDAVSEPLTHRRLP